MNKICYPCTKKTKQKISGNYEIGICSFCKQKQYVVDVWQGQENELAKLMKMLNIK